MTDKKLRGGHRAMATKLIVNIEGLVQSTLLDENEIKAAMSELKRHKEKIITYDEKIHLTLDDEELISDMEECSNRLLLIDKALSIAEDCLVRMHPSHLDSSHYNNGNTPYLGVKLPTLNLPKFKGDPLDWSHFWDIFNNAVHIRTDISDAQKFVYLTGQLQGEAAELLDGFTTTDANYGEAIKLLEETYGDPKRIIQSHLHSIFDLKGPNPNAEDLSKYRSSYECHLRGLKALGTKVDEAGFVLAALLLRKLPPRIRDNINRAARSNYWELQEFRKAINDEIILLQAIEPESKDNKTSKWQTKTKSKSFPVKGHKAHSTVSNFNIASSKYEENKKYEASCRLCFNKHSFKDCDQYKSPREKSERAKRLNLCTKCLANTHLVSNCFSQITCSSCKGHHNTALCFKKDSTTSSESKVASNIAHTKDDCSGVALPTAQVQIKGKSHVKQVRALFDQGSQRTFLLQFIADELKLKPKRYLELSIDGFNSRGKTQKYPVVQLEVLCNKNIIIIDALLVHTLPRKIIMPGLTKTLSELKKWDVQIADPDIKEDMVENISLLIGADFYYNFVTGYKSIDDIHLITSLCGDMVSGRLQTTEVSTNTVTVLKITEGEIKSLDTTLKQFWSLDSVGINPDEISCKDSEAYEKFKTSLKYEDGHYVASLPWKKDHPKLANNFLLAKCRLKGVLKQLKRNNLLHRYDQLIKEQLRKDFIEIVSDAVPYKAHYIPHLPVMRNSETTPLRIVYDCSAGHPSLNDCLLTGPSLTNELGNILLKFRLNRYACSSDIEKAFLNIHLNKNDRDYTRFLWPENPLDSNSPLLTYRFKVVLFGATCSPFLLNASIKLHLESEDSNLAKIIQKNLYIDNLIYTTNSKEDLIEFYEESKVLMKRAGFTLKQWVSNFDKLNLISQNNYDYICETKKVKILGMLWEPTVDTLHFKFTPKLTRNGTKRTILQMIASVYDPLGFLLPVTIKGRIFMQSLWKLKIGWDDNLPCEINEEWNRLREEIINTLNFSIPRMVNFSNSVILHSFSDASSKAYGATIYMVSSTVSCLLISKAKVSPIKTLTIPQLELTAAVLSARLVNYTIKAFESLHISNIYFWTDSQIVLRWLDTTKILKPYLQNRIDEINKLFPNSVWKFVSSTDNPSDFITRGKPSKILRSDEWLRGPSWLPYPAEWPNWNELNNEDETSDEVNVVIPVQMTSNLLDLTKFSSLNKLI